MEPLPPHNDYQKTTDSGGESQIPLTVADLQKQVDDWIKTLGVRYFSELTNLAQLMEEVGELSRVISRTYGEQSWKQSDRAYNLADEMADILFVLVCLANQTGVDLTSAIQANLAKKTKRDANRHVNNPKLSNPEC
ncbi:MAG: nucleotide pyrophosphohydrolase [Planctomycetota bacterium]|nr:nucleotide pyrophosphohydrolase [Planctomycetota bacterium]